MGKNYFIASPDFPVTRDSSEDIIDERQLAGDNRSRVSGGVILPASKLAKLAQASVESGWVVCHWIGIAQIFGSG
jgi:hypothetical protein